MNIRLFISALLLCCFTLIANANPKDTQTKLTGDQLLHRWVHFWNAKDVSQIDLLYTDNAVLEDVAEGTTYEGLAAIKQCLLEDITYAPDITVEIISILVVENRGILEWKWSGTQTGDIPGLMPATGNKFSIRGVSIFEFEQSKISRQSDYYDAATFLYQLGVKFEFPTKK